MPPRTSSRIFSFRNLSNPRMLKRTLTYVLHGLVILSMLSPNVMVLAASGTDSETGNQSESTQVALEDFIPRAATEEDSAESEYVPPQFEHPEPRQVERGDTLETLESPLQADACQAGGDLVLASGEACSLAAGSHTYDSILVQDGGTLYMEGNTTTEEGVSITVDSFTVDSGGLVTADGAGYEGGEGPGTALEASTGEGAGGGAHGGQGGDSTTAGGEVYNSSPLGSGGGDRGSASGGTGGGEISLTVDDTLVVNGTLTASGENGGEDDGGAGGGAGGTIHIFSIFLSGSGLIQANGGEGGDSSTNLDGGGGGGGRISITAMINNYSGSVQAYGGNGAQYGGPGTINWVNDENLIIDNNGHDGAAAGLVNYYTDFNEIVLSNYGHLTIFGTGSTLDLDTTEINGDGTAMLTVYGTVAGPAELNLTGGYSLDVLGALTDVMNLEIGGGSTLILHAVTPLHSGGTTFNSIAVYEGGTLDLDSYDNGDTDYTNDSGFQLQADSIYVEENGRISADGHGYAGGSGPGTAASNGNDGVGGGSHGGQGGNSTTPGGEAYDDVYQPRMLGRGGGNTSRVSGGAGGGAIHLVTY